MLFKKSEIKNLKNICDRYDLLDKFLLDYKVNYNTELTFPEIEYLMAIIPELEEFFLKIYALDDEKRDYLIINFIFEWLIKNEKKCSKK